MNPPLISICIPAYKRTDHIKRLLDSISIQRFTDFEVVVTDDSPDQEVAALCEQYRERLPLSYYRNPTPLGTPENWNEGIRRAVGDWIKLMHDDDWFTDEESLGHFAAALHAAPRAIFFFSAYRNCYLDEGRTEDVFIRTARYKAVLKNPAVLFRSNVIGPPSVVMHKRIPAFLYDNKVKWVVDIDLYMRTLGEHKPVYIDKILINIGLGSQQVTADCFRRRPIEIPENFYLLNKVGAANLRNLWVYDAWWRLMRNLEIRQRADIVEAGYHSEIPRAISAMIGQQRKIPRTLLKNGFFSKPFMFLSYLFNFNKIEK